MEDVKETIYKLIRDDTTIQGYTGYVASDPRVYYAWLPLKFEVNANTPAYITYHLATGDKTSWDRETEIYTINLYSNNPETNEDIFERLDIILHHQIQTGLADNYMTNIRRLAQMDLFDEGVSLYVKSLSYEVTSVPQ